MIHVDNKEVAAVFFEMADLLHINGGNPYRVRAFQRSARIIENLPEPVEVMLRFGTLQKRPGVGPGTVHRVKQILRTGTCDDHRQLRSELPPGLRDMLDVKGMGARTVRLIWQHLKIGSIDELELAARQGRLLKLPRMGQGTTDRILRGIDAWRKRRGRVPYVDARKRGRRMIASLEELPEVQRIALAGSFRRGKATVGDMDILVASDDPLVVASKFVTLPMVEEVLIRGSGRCQVRLDNRQQVDLRVLPQENFGAGLHYFTGAQLHNIHLRARANRFGLKISDKGIFWRKDESLIKPGMREEEIFAAVGLPFIPPEIRENLGEIEAAAEGRVPRLVEAADLRGDLHMHTRASDGKGTVDEMVAAARAMGHEYIAITDHTAYCTVANGQDDRQLAAQLHHIREVQARTSDLQVAAGVEVDILPDGSLDIDLDLLRQLDWVIASVHSHLGMGPDEMTDRIVAAIKSGVVDCIGHPTNRRLGHRDGNVLDWDRILQACRTHEVALEVNGNPHRMDLPDVQCRMAKASRVPVCINTDSHSPGHLSYQEFGLLTARRGWLGPSDVLNTRPWAEIAERRRERLRSANFVAVQPAPRPAPDPDPQPHSDDLALLDGEPGEEGAPAMALEALVAELEHPPLDDALKERLSSWMAGHDDPPMDKALNAISEQPLQLAFNLLAQ